MSINHHLLLLGAAERVYLYASGLIFMRSCYVIRVTKSNIIYEVNFPVADSYFKKNQDHITSLKFLNDSAQGKSR